MNKPNNNNRTPRIIRKIYRFVRGVFALIGVLFVISYLCFDISEITSNSMAPTLQGSYKTQRDVILTEKVSYWFRQPRRWEIVRYPTYDELGFVVMKRIAALKGEKISIKDHWVHINGQPIERPSHLKHLKYYAVGSLHRGKEVHCKDGYFVFGDANIDSYDSRFTGTIKESNIIGRAWLKIWPPSRIGFVK